MSYPSRPPKVLYFRDTIHRPGFGATESWALPEGSEILENLGVLIPCDNGQSTLVPWSNIKNVLWDAMPASAVVPLKAKKSAK